jgi:hypothetical protein
MELLIGLFRPGPVLNFVLQKLGKDVARVFISSASNNISHPNATTMKQIIILLFASMPSLQMDIGNYYHKDVSCSFYFSLVKEYQLNLKEKNKFQLNIKTSDTRFSGNRRELIEGEFEYRKDTLFLRLEDKFKGHRTNEVSYLSVADRLVILKQNLGFPSSLKKTKVPPLLANNGVN